MTDLSNFQLNSTAKYLHFVDTVITSLWVVPGKETALGVISVQLRIRPCPDSKIKSVSGDNSTLCQDVCDGTTNVPNGARTACGECLYFNGGMMNIIQ